MDDSHSGSTSVHLAAGSISTTAPPASSEQRLPSRRIWVFALAAGVAAGLISWAAGEFAVDAFKPRLYRIVVPPGAVTFAPTSASANAAQFKNSVLTFALLGCVTGLAMGFSGGLAARSPRRGMIAGLAAQAAGLLVGAIISLALVRFFYRGLVQDLNDLWSPVLIHGAIGMAIGAVGGAAFALGMGCPRRHQAAIGAAVVGGLFAPILFQTLSATFLPGANTMGPIADSRSARLLAMLLITLLIAVGAARGVQGHGTRSATTASNH
jgi:hypothetical protein